MAAHPSSANVIRLYDRHASRWAKDRGKVLFEQQWLDTFRALLPQSGTVLDLGCGTGEPIGTYLVGCGYRLTGVDSSPAMIAISKYRHPHQRWLTADMRVLASGETFDGVLAWDSFFHLTPDDQRAMFATFKAHAHKGTALMFTSGPQAGEAIGSYQGEDLYHSSLAPDEYRALLASTGFEVVIHKAEDQECGGHTVWLAKSII
jgi:predicted TPR repeat methyltransferase